MSQTTLKKPKQLSTSYQLTPDDLKPEQHDAIDYLYGGDGILIAGVGFGKAVVGQTAAQELLDDGVLKRVLVLAPLKVCTLTWQLEHLGWSHLEPVACALGTPAERVAAIESGARIVVLNLENVKWFFRHYGKAHGFDGLLIDELSKLKSAGSAAVKALRPRLGDFAWRAGMSATPVAESGVDIYAQALVIDGGAALGTRQDEFLIKYFYPADYERRNWTLQPGAAERLAAALAGLVFVADDGSYRAGLPELRDEIVNVDLPADAHQAYSELAAEMCVRLEAGEVEAVNAAVLSGKLLQLAGGAVYDADGEVLRIHSAKFLALRRLIDEAAGPVMVCYTYLWQLTELRWSYGNLVVLGDDPARAMADWNAGKIKILAVHPKSASHGLNLQAGGHELIILTPIWSADLNEQLVGRLRRRGQLCNFVRRTTIVATGTVDDLVLEGQDRKAGAAGLLMDHIKGAAKNV
jgi:hypothetical protein